MLPGEGRSRVIIEGVTPEIDGGRFPIKRIAGDETTVEANCLTDGHDALSCALLYRKEGAASGPGAAASGPGAAASGPGAAGWSDVPMESLGNDRWRASFRVTELGRYYYTVQAWVDHFKSWARDLGKRVQAGQDVAVELLIGAELVEAASRRAPAPHSGWLASFAEGLRAGGPDAAQQALSPELARLMSLHAERSFAATYVRELEIIVDRERARFAAWYELFPRSTAIEPGRHGTFGDVERRLPYIASSMCSICRPFIPSAAASARDATTPRLRIRMIRAAPGPSARRRVGIRRSTRSSAHSRISVT